MTHSAYGSVYLYVILSIFPGFGIKAILYNGYTSRHILYDAKYSLNYQSPAGAFY